MGRTHFFRQFKRALKAAGAQKSASTSSRRTFIKLAAATTVVPFIPPLLFPRSSEEPVIILGAGAAGLAAAYTLAKNQIPFHLYEANQRIGGRIFTHSPFNREGQFCELGAELVDTDHLALRGLCQELGVELENFRDENLPYSMEAELFFFQGQVYSTKEFVDGLEPFLEILEDISTGRTPAPYKDVTAFDHISLAEFLDQMRDAVDSWVLDAVGVAYIGEMGLELDQISSLNLIALWQGMTIDDFQMFGPSDEVSRIKGGSSQLIQKLYEAAAKQSSSKFFLGHKLVHVAESGTNLKWTFQTPSGLTQIKSQRAICTLPFSVLRHVDGVKKLSLSPVKQKAIKHLSYGTNSKLMLSFHQRFWRNPKKDLPALSGTIYGDFPSQSFWETSRLQKGASGILTNYLGGAKGASANPQTTPAMALADLNSLYGENLPLEKSVLFNWTHLATAMGSYSCFGVGQVTKFFGQMSSPEYNGQLVFAGEHLSDDWQGFMEGAFATGIGAAQHFCSMQDS